MSRWAALAGCFCGTQLMRDEVDTRALHTLAGMLLRMRAAAQEFQAEVELIVAIHAAAEGDALIAPSVTVRLLATFATSRAEAARQPLEPLTAREEEVLVTVARGRTNDEIASELFITTSTVKAHVASLMRKLGARNRVEVAMWAHESGRV